jgi:predicted nucleic acid-binding Zn ribbon protein
MSHGSLEFDCTDCDHCVVSITPPHSPGRRCAGCQFIAELVNPVDREELRVWMAERGIIGTPHKRVAVRAAAAYRDQHNAMRHCVNCGRPYRGPAMVCSQSCALALGKSLRPPSHAHRMFVVTEAEAAAIRETFVQSGELAAAAEMCRLFPGVDDLAQARPCARRITGWEPLPPLSPTADGAACGPPDRRA